MTSSRPVVCNAGPLIHLDELGCTDLLNDFASVLVPQAVWAEVARHRPGALSQPFLTRSAPAAASDLGVVALCRAFSLDAGESACIALLGARRDLLFLTDDTAARLVAEQMGVDVHGTLGVLLRSVRRGQRTAQEVLDFLDEIPTRSSLHVARALLADVKNELRRNWGVPP